jgi:hypothetical protein
MWAVVLGLLLMLGAPSSQAPAIVAEANASGDYGVAALQARLNGQRRYTLQVDGPPGVPFTARYMQVFVSHQPQAGGSGNQDGSFDGVTPYQRALDPPAPGLLFWRYSVVVSPNDPAELAVRVLDGPLP